MMTMIIMIMTDNHDDDDKHDPQDARGVVYHIKCDGSEFEDESPCSESYTCEMERSLRSRFLEH